MTPRPPADGPPPVVTGPPREVLHGGWTSSWVDLDGPLHYLDLPARRPAGRSPQGPPIVLVHGLGGSVVDWLALAPDLAEDHRVLVPDLPGHGYSPAAGRRPDIGGLARLLARFLDATSARDAVLIGNSLGGAVAARHAAEHPGATRGLVLVDPVLPLGGLARPHPLVLAGFAAYATPWLGSRLLRGRRAVAAPELQVERGLGMICAAPSGVPADVVGHAVRLAEHRASRRPGRTEDDALFLRLAREVVRTVARPATYRRTLDRIAGPVLLVHGVQDRFVPVAAARRAAVAHPAWESAFLDHAGHLPQLEAADRVASAIRGWLGRTPARVPAA